MPTIKIPVPIIQTLNRSTSGTIGWFTQWETAIEIETFDEADIPVAVSWSDEEDYLIRYEKGTRRFWRLAYDQAGSIEKLPLNTIWEENLFDTRYLCDGLLKTFQQFHPEAYVELESTWGRRNRVNAQRRVLRSDPAVDAQVQQIQQHMAARCLIGGKIYSAVREPVAVIQTFNKTPLITVEPVPWTYEGTVMVFSLRDLQVAQALADKVSVDAISTEADTEIHELDQAAFGPADPQKQKAAFLRFFEAFFRDRLLNDPHGVALFLGNLTQEDKNWLARCAACLDDLDQGIVSEAMKSTVDELLCKQTRSGLDYLFENRQDFELVRNTLVQQLNAGRSV